MYLLYTTSRSLLQQNELVLRQGGVFCNNVLAMHAAAAQRLELTSARCKLQASQCSEAGIEFYKLHAAGCWCSETGNDFCKMHAAGA